ncbi:hypothetical protein J3B02_003197 [Coemansia erecta]|nr:hypothetical protein J3B02_003197 [Coemansia erecta]
MKFAFSSALSIAAIFAVSATADVAGTRTIVISLTSDEQGQIIPVILHKNSAGYEPVGISTSVSSISDDANIINSDSDSDSVEINESQEGGEDISLDSSKLQTPFPAENTPTPDEQQTMPASPIAEEETQAETENQAQESSVSLVDAAAPETTTPVDNADPGSGSDSDSDSEQEAASNSNSASAQQTGKSTAAKNHSSAALALAALLAMVITI